MHEVALLSSRFRFTDRALFFPKARLYRDHITFSGLQWKGRYRLTVPLAQVTRVEWQTTELRATNFAIHLHNGETLWMWLKGAGRWKFKIEEHAPNLISNDVRPLKPLTSAA